jgi:hypothetical protein
MSEATYRARYWRYHSKGEEECDTLDEAVAFLAYGFDSGNLSAADVVGPDGAVVLQGEELSERIMAVLGV